MAIKLSSIFKPKTVTTSTKSEIKGYRIPEQKPDVFVRQTGNLPKKDLPKFELKNNITRAEQEQEHERRMEAFGDESPLLPHKEVSKAQLNAVNQVQWEMDEYSDCQRKLKNHEPLNQNELEFLHGILSAMNPVEEDTVLFRNISPYEGFEEQVNNGELSFDCLTSTNCRYDDFFSFWAAPVLLKINVPKGFHTLDCNVKHKKHGPRMRTEVVLPPSKAIVNNIDNEHRIIEVTLTEEKMI